MQNRFLSRIFFTITVLALVGCWKSSISEDDKAACLAMNSDQVTGFFKKDIEKYIFSGQYTMSIPVFQPDKSNPFWTVEIDPKVPNKHFSTKTIGMFFCSRGFEYTLVK